MSEAALQIKGLYQFRSSLKKAGADLGDLKEANIAVERVVAQRAAEIAPKRTGRLAGSLKTPRLAARAAIRSNLIYAGVIHWGWARRGIKGQPFVTDAVAQTRDQWMNDYEAACKKVSAQVHGV